MQADLRQTGLFSLNYKVKRALTPPSLEIALTRSKVAPLARGASWNYLRRLRACHVIVAYLGMQYGWGGEEGEATLFLVTVSRHPWARRRHEFQAAEALSNTHRRSQVVRHEIETKEHRFSVGHAAFFAAHI